MNNKTEPIKAQSMSWLTYWQQIILLDTQISHVMELLLIESRMNVRNPIATALEEAFEILRDIKSFTDLDSHLMNDVRESVNKYKTFLKQVIVCWSQPSEKKCSAVLSRLHHLRLSMFFHRWQHGFLSHTDLRYGLRNAIRAFEKFLARPCWDRIECALEQARYEWEYMDALQPLTPIPHDLNQSDPVHESYRLLNEIGVAIQTQSISYLNRQLDDLSSLWETSSSSNHSRMFDIRRPLHE